MLALSVRQRVREIGIRMALGATPRDVLRVVIRQGMALVAIGMAIGLAGGVALTGVLKALLFEVAPTDLATYVLVSARAIGRGLAGVLPAGAAGCAASESWRKLQLAGGTSVPLLQHRIRATMVGSSSLSHARRDINR
jgi:ABC-type antimicrobial peptide transport system permease subunit